MKLRNATTPFCAEYPATCAICKGPLTFLTDTSPVTMRASMRSVSEDIRQVSETACGMAANGPNLLTARKSCHKTPGDRTSVVKGKSVSVRVELGGRRSITKKISKNKLKERDSKQQ